MTFGEWVLARRQDLRQTRAVASEAIGVCPNTLKNWEKDRSNPRTIEALQSLVDWSGERADFVERFLS